MPSPTDRVLLEVEIAHERDVAGAIGGGADRLHVVGGPEPAVVSAICHASAAAGDRPVFVQVDDRADALDHAREVVACGAVGVALGRLDGDLEVDVAACAELLDGLSGVPWTFTRAVDDTLDPRRSWRRLTRAALPGLAGVCSAGSPRGMAEGADDLLATVEADPAVAALLIAGGGLVAETVPWLLRAGVRAFRIEAQARPGGSSRAYVDADLVRSWRTLLDDEVQRV